VPSGGGVARTPCAPWPPPAPAPASAPAPARCAGRARGPVASSRRRTPRGSLA
jgi:hypothetical protein